MFLLVGAFLVSLVVFIFYVFLHWLASGKHIKSGGTAVSPEKVHMLKSYVYLDNLNYKKYLQEVIEGTKTIKYFDEIPHSLPYEVLNDSATFSIHIGQLKLFLTEVEFLTEKLSKHDEEVIMVYAGSAPCMHASFLSNMFPKLKIVCVDPNEHIIYYPNHKSSYDFPLLKSTVYFKATLKNMYKSKYRNIQMYDSHSKSIRQLEKGRHGRDIERIGKSFDAQIERKDYKPIVNYIKNTNYKYYIIEDYFTDNIAELCAAFGAGNFLFCSDIRSRESSRMMPGDMDLLWNLAMQYNWLNIMQPAHCMLKFRCPFFEQEDREQFAQLLKDDSSYGEIFEESKKLGLDFIADYTSKKFRYIKPDKIYIQAFAGPSSSEARLIASKYADVTEFDWKDYQDKFFYYNQAIRQYGYHNDYESVYDKDLCFDACGDCGLTYQIMLEYYQKFEPKNANPKFVKTQIDALMQLLRRKFYEHRSLHGKYLKKYENINDIMAKQRELIIYSIYRDNIDLLRSSVKK
jgi:hypothetical protein